VKVVWLMLAGILLGYIFAAEAPPQVAAAVETGLRARYETSYALTEPIAKEPSQWAFLNNIVVLFLLAYGGVLVSYVKLGKEQDWFYGLVAKIDRSYERCRYRDELFSIQLLPYGGSFLNGTLVGYISRKAQVSLLQHVPLEVLGLLIAAGIGERIEKELRGLGMNEFVKRRSGIVKSFKYWPFFVGAVWLIIAAAGIEFSWVPKPG